MNSHQTQLFRHVLKTSGCLAAATRVVGIPPEAVPEPRPAPSRPGPAQAPDSTPEADLERAVAALESEAVRRALEGVHLPVYHQGRECGSTTKHSDQLLMFLLKTLKPERYASGKEPAQPGTRPVVLEIDLSGADEGCEEQAEE